VRLLEKMCHAADASGDLIADAQIAVIAVEHAAELMYFDRDFARLDELSWHKPEVIGE
jgi:predicted nucleic acid-binding protein